MKFNGSFGDWLKQRRKALDLTQRDLADQVGCAEVTIRKIEGGVSRPSRQIAERMADVLAIASDERAAFISFARRLADKPPALPLDAPSAPIHNLPPQPTPFIGREQELAQIAERLANPACRLLTLVGPGGIGKTRLALQAAEQIDNFAYGVYFVSLAPVGAPDQIASAIAGALKISFYGPESPDVQIVNYLREKRVLLLLDNFEHLLGGTGLLTDILAGAPQVKLLVTSRERLNVQEEWVLPIEGLPFPERTHSAPVDSYSAVQLFAQCARRLQPNFSLVDNAESVITICRVVEGMPLGLELAATWLRVIPCKQIVKEIERGLDFLANPLRNVPERHRSLRAVFGHSWNLLTEGERTVLMKLSVFRGGFDLEAAEQVAGATLSILAGLADKSLVRMNQSGRYDLHELLRQYAQDKLDECGEAQATSNRHLEYYLELVEQAEVMLYTPDQVAWHDRLEADHDNLRAALSWALAGSGAALGLRLAAALEWFWHMRLYAREGRTWIEKLLAAANNAPAILRAKALHRAGDLTNILWEEVRARALNKQALALAHSIGDQWNTAWALSNLGFASQIENPQQAMTLHEEALALFRELGDSWGINHALARLGMAASLAMETERAKKVFNECLALARAANVKSAIAWALRMSAERVVLPVGDVGRAMALIQEAASLFRETHMREGLYMTLPLLGVLASAQGDSEQAQLILDESLTLLERVGGHTGYAFRYLSRVARIKGDLERSQALVRESLSKERSAGNTRGIARCFRVLGGLALDFGQPEKAAALLGAADFVWELPNRYDDVVQLDETVRDVAAIRAQLGEAAFAAAWAEGQAMSLDQAIAYALSC